jgi:stearoyl-CoA desaturase (Delta-9 desaturase)
MPLSLMCYFGESLNVAWNVNVLRYVVSLNIVWCVNSVAHIWGEKPFDKNISSTDSYSVAFFDFGEGWHNYHHVFPWDYKTSELPLYVFNFSCLVIEFFAWLGWATELKTVKFHPKPN